MKGVHSVTRARILSKDCEVETYWYAHIAGQKTYMGKGAAGQIRAEEAKEKEIAHKRTSFKQRADKLILENQKKIMKTYLVGNRERGIVKIGKTIDIDLRISALNNACPFSLECYCVIENDCEKELHRRFEKNHIKGEWFSLSPEIETFIGCTK